MIPALRDDALEAAKEWLQGEPDIRLPRMGNADASLAAKFMEWHAKGEAAGLERADAAILDEKHLSSSVDMTVARICAAVRELRHAAAVRALGGGR